MITYVTCDDVDNAFGNAWTSENAKNKAVLMANAWLNGFNLKINPSRIPEEVKLAGAYAARIASFGKLFQQKNDSGVVISKAVSAGRIKICHCFPIFFQSVQINIQNVSDLLCSHPARCQRLDFRIRNHLSPPLICRVSSSCIFREGFLLQRCSR